VDADVDIYVGSSLMVLLPCLLPFTGSCFFQVSHIDF
jgi:hypothetical protein